MSKMPGQIRVVCITGPFGCGKTALARYLQSSYGIPTLFMDLVGHYMLTKPEVRTEVIRLLGDGVVRNGRVMRSEIAKYVFRNRELMNAYNHLMWSHMDKFMARILSDWLSNFGKAIIEAAVLYEAGWDKYCDYTIAVLTPVGKILTRKNMDLKEYCLRRRWQLPDREFIKRAQLVICNRGTQMEMFEVATMHLKELGFLPSH